MVSVGSGTCFAEAQPPISPDRLAVAADRIESLVILGEDNAASGGAYAFRGGDPIDLKIEKIGGSGDIGDSKPIGTSALRWNLVIDGNIGYLSGKGQIQRQPLAGDMFKVSTFGAELGGGARIWLSSHLSVAPGVSAIYGQTSETISASTGRVNTWSAVPWMDLQYRWKLGDTAVTFKSLFNYFHTESFNSSGAVLHLSGNSQTWKNTFDFDVPLNWRLWGHQLHTGGHIDQTQLFGDFRDGLNTAHLYTVDGRLVVDVLSTFHKVLWLGLGSSYTWSGNLSGWAAGVDIRLKL